MPYKVEGNKVMHYKDGKWSVKQTAKSRANAMAAMRLLEGLEHGSIKQSEVGRGSFAKEAAEAAKRSTKIIRGKR